MKAILGLLLLAITASAASPALAQDKAEQGRELLQQAIEALGGEAFLKLESAKMEGRVYSFRRDPLRGRSTFFRYPRYPDQQRDEYGQTKETNVVYSCERCVANDIQLGRACSGEGVQITVGGV